MKTKSEAVYRAQVKKITRGRPKVGNDVAVEDLLRGRHAELATRMLPIVTGIAGKFRYAEKYQGIDFMDIVQTGNIALLNAIRTWNPDKNMPFVLWCKMCVSRAIKRFIKSNYSQDLSIDGIMIDSDDDGNSHRYSLISDQLLDTATPEMQVSIEQEIDNLFRKLHALTTKQLIVVVEHLGIADGDPKTFKQIGETYHASETAIKKLYQRGLRSIKKRSL